LFSEKLKGHIVHVHICFQEGMLIK